MGERVIKTAKTAGFCFGVKRAVEKVYDQVRMEKRRSIRMDPSSITRKWCRIWNPGV